MKQNCSTCRYWQPPEPDEWGMWDPLIEIGRAAITGEEVVGICRRTPPPFAEIEHTQWCGEWQRVVEVPN